MQLTELQMGLIALGVVGVGAVIGYNMWQERRHRRTAERALGEARPDVLIDPLAPAAKRVEPTLDIDLGEPIAPELPPAVEPPAQDALASAQREPVVSPRSGDAASPLSVDRWLDERIDERMVVEFGSPVAATEFHRAWRELAHNVDATVRVRGRDEQADRWLDLGPETAGMLSRLELALQLADRRGPVSEATLEALMQALQAVADRFLAVVHLPDARELLNRARELDGFAAAVDVQIGLNLVAGEQALSGTKLRALAEAQGLVLDGGQFHARDDAGATLFTLGNLDAARFSADTMKTLQTQGVTLLLDVPTVADGARLFDRMVHLAEQFAHTLGARVVDDNRQPLSPASLGLIRNKIAEFQARMAQFGVPPGSDTARRLFS
ncbi:cell division protein ZipA C-terminal FtsZ-binding domain-containing protein [Methyloversatilis thermotolerans]|uniref:cell division protein ZipA C-terminal FtsZ-binding domain-containing protein n=1 Tax=Methyloversatilis thermotolerans TaxID=1346290 RepID=UPI0003825A8C|nr:cell division protein ZipA C-terminal FtsZ-binding domain-containing protein [Methyloversatilis thermotolerans]